MLYLAHEHGHFQPHVFAFNSYLGLAAREDNVAAINQIHLTKYGSHMLKNFSSGHCSLHEFINLILRPFSSVPVLDPHMLQYAIRF